MKLVPIITGGGNYIFIRITIAFSKHELWLRRSQIVGVASLPVWLLIFLRMIRIIGSILGRWIFVVPLLFSLGCSQAPGGCSCTGIFESAVKAVEAFPTGELRTYTRCIESWPPHETMITKKKQPPLENRVGAACIT